MVSLRYVHHSDNFLDRNCLVCIDRECRILLALEKVYELVLDAVESDRSLVTVDVV